MDGFAYIDIIGNMENNETKRLIGKINIDVLKNQRIESLYYIFPLIEKMILEIYKLVPDADVEYYEQGKIKTIMSIIEKNEKLKILPIDLVNIIKKYYKDKCPRNDLFHVKDNITSIEVSFKELNYIIMELLSILNRQIKLTTDYSFEHIDLL